MEKIKGERIGIKKNEKWKEGERLKGNKKIER